MKSNGFIKRFAVSVLLALGAVTGTSAQNLILVSGTDFSSPGNENEAFVSWPVVEAGSEGFLGIIKPQVQINVPVCETTEFDARSSDFIGGRYYCITNNPCKIDSFRFFDTEEKEWGILLPKGTSAGANAETFMTFKVNGLSAGSDYRVEIDYCFVGDYSKKWSTGYPGVNYNTGSQQVEFGGIDPKIRFVVNPDQYNTTSGPDQGFTTANKTARGCETMKVTKATSNCGVVSSTGELQLNINSTQQTGAIFITAIRVYANITPKISGVESVCAGGEKGIISVGAAYAGATYQWYRDGIKLTGETGKTCAHTSDEGNTGSHEYYYEMTVSDGNGGNVTLKSPVWTIKDIMCCQNDDGTPASRKLIYWNDFGTFTSDSGTDFYVWDYTDLSEPKKVSYTTSTPFRTNLPAIGEEAPEGAAGTDIMSADAHSMVAWISDGDGSKIGWAAQCDNGGYWGPGRANGPFFPDHTDQLNGTGKYGAALFVNAAKGDHTSNPIRIYKQEIKGICEQTHLTVKCYINNFSNGETPIQVRIKAYDSDHLEDPNFGGESDIIKRDATGLDQGWKEVSVDIPKIESRKLTFEILDYSENSNDQGDDLILDDIMVFACSSPSVDLYFSLDDYSTDSSTCVGDDIKLFVDETAMLKNFYDTDLTYLYQYTWEDPESVNFKKSWKNLNPRAVKASSYSDMIEEIIEEMKSNFSSSSDYPKIYFRVVAGNENVINNEIAGDNYFNPNDPCSNMSISKPIELTIECPECTNPKAKIKIKASKNSEKKKNGKNVIELCYNESVTLEQENDITPAESDWASPNFKGYSIKWFEADKPGALSGATTVLNDKIEPKEIKYDDITLAETEMSVVLYAVDALYPDGSCKTGDTVYIKFNPIPTAKYRDDHPEFCKGKAAGAVSLDFTEGKTASDFLVTWWKGETDADTAGNSIGENLTVAEIEGFTESQKLLYQLKDSETGCLGELQKFEVTVNPVPEPPLDENPQYTINSNIAETIDPLEVFVQPLNLTDYDLVWFRSDDPAVQPDLLGLPSESVNRTVETGANPQIFYIAYRDKVGGCYSERAKVTVEVLSAPKPKVKDIDMCKGERFDYMDGIVENKTGYDLVWFKDPTDTVGKALPTPPATTVNVTTPGKYTYYVAQRDQNAPYAQSDIESFDVIVYDVKAPLDASKHEYCAYDDAEPLNATKQEDLPNYYGADDVWFKFGEEQKTFTPDTRVNSDQTYDYVAFQKFKTPLSKQECKGPEVPIQITVKSVDKPVLKQSISYVKNEALPSRVFKDVVDKYPGAFDVIPGQELAWSQMETGPFVTGSTASSKPFYDDTKRDQVEHQQLWVIWQAQVGTMTCKSKPTKVEITISSTPAPTVSAIDICEEDFKASAIPSTKEPDQNASLNNNGGSLDVTAYSLYWFTDKNDAESAMTNPTLLTGKETAPTFASVFSGVDMSSTSAPSWSKSLYVVQADGTTNGSIVSPAAEMVLTVNASPKLQPGIDVPVCNGPVNLTDNKYWNVENGVTVNATYTLDGMPAPNASELYKAGRYDIIAKSSPYECVSDPLHIELDIRTLSIELEDKSTCPDDDVNQDIKISYTYNKNATSGASATLNWTVEAPTSVPSGTMTKTQTGTVTRPAGGYDITAPFVESVRSGNFPGVADDIHTVSVTVDDGVCSATKDYLVEIGDGKAEGYYSWSEVGNRASDGAKTTISKANKDNIVIYACGNPVTVDFSDVMKDDNNVEWFEDPAHTILAKTAVAPVFTQSEYKTYYVRYLNNCYAYATVTIKDASIKINTLPQGPVSECEGESYNVAINYTCSVADRLGRQWYLNNQTISLNRDDLTLDPLMKQDEGVYDIEYTNYGCSARLNGVVDLTVKQYVKVDVDASSYEMYQGKKSQIVIAGDPALVNFSFTVPDNASDIAALTHVKNETAIRNDGSVSADNMSYSISAVDEDHIVTVEFEDPNKYCKGHVDFQVLRDAKLKLDASVETAMCLHENKKLTIDTIGTGAFRREGMELKVTATTDGGVSKVEKGFKTDSQDSLYKMISPLESTTYHITFDYGTQHLDKDIRVVVYDLKVFPVNDTVCAGEPVTLDWTVSPPEASVEWFDEDKNSLGDNPGTVYPKFNGAPNVPRSVYRYYARAYSTAVTCKDNPPTPLNVTVYRPLDGHMEDQEICEGETVRVDASSYGATSWTWTVGGDEIKGNRVYQDTPLETTVYKVHMTRGNVCEKDTQVTVTVNKNPVIESIDSVNYRDVNVVMAGGYGTEPYRYRVDDGEWTESASLTGLAYTIHTLDIEDAKGCTLRDTFVVNDPMIIIPHWFSPNGDGEFDKWTVPSIKDTYPEAEFTIFDRWGKKLIEFKGADDGWDGTYNGVDMPSTDYWYELIIREIDKIYTGHFTLIRR